MLCGIQQVSQIWYSGKSTAVKAGCDLDPDRIEAERINDAASFYISSQSTSRSEF